MAAKPLLESEYVGKRYGLLTILKFDGYREGSTSLYVSAICDCGNIKSIQLSSLKNGATKSCGCLGKINVDSYIGKVYNRLTILSYFRDDKNNLFLNCICSCGNTKAIRFFDVINEKTKSCGCLSIETTIENNKNRKRYNDYEYIDPQTIKVKLSNCEDYMICDSSTWDLLKSYLWRKHYSGYAETDTEDGKIIMYHTMILECPEGYVRDHINRNRLDNRYINLRVVTPTGNAINRSILDKNKSGHPGVYYDKYHNRWRSFYTDPITKRKMFSNFDTYEEALANRLENEEKYYNIESVTTNKIIDN